jgi:hypothetical protein
LLTCKMFLRLLYSSLLIDFVRGCTLCWRDHLGLAIGAIFMVIFINLSRCIRVIIIRLFMCWFILAVGGYLKRIIIICSFFWFIAKLADAAVQQIISLIFSL